MKLVRQITGKITKNRLNSIELYQAGKRFVFVTDIEKLGLLMEQKTGLIFKYEIAKGCNYFYNFWLEKPSKKLKNQL